MTLATMQQSLSDEGISTRDLGNKNHQKLEILGIRYSVCVFRTSPENIRRILQI